MKKKNIAIVGINGIPARYGGFETLAENLVNGLKDDFYFTVYCSKTQTSQRRHRYNGARLIYLPLRANGWQSILFDTFSLFHALFYSDAILVLGPSFGFVYPIRFLFLKALYVNHGGLNEWEREKLSRIQKKYVFWSHYIAAKAATCNIADNNILKESILSSFQEKAIVIRYGGDHAKVPECSVEMEKKYNLKSGEYFISVARAQIDNNIHIALESFSRSPMHSLVMISNWGVSDYGKQLFVHYSECPNIRLLNAIYDQSELNLLRGNARAYIHTHSRCGTAPSLVEAICLGLPIISYDVPTNRETTQGNAQFFTTSDELLAILDNFDSKTAYAMRDRLCNIAQNEYTWAKICSDYRGLLSIVK